MSSGISADAMYGGLAVITSKRCDGTRAKRSLSTKATLYAPRR